MIEDMTVRGFGAKTRHDYVRHVSTFAAFIGRSPDERVQPGSCRRQPQIDLAPWIGTSSGICC
jgi:hypothetical protein